MTGPARTSGEEDPSAWIDAAGAFLGILGRRVRGTDARVVRFNLRLPVDGRGGANPLGVGVEIFDAAAGREAVLSADLLPDLDLRLEIAAAGAEAERRLRGRIGFPRPAGDEARAFFCRNLVEILRFEGRWTGRDAEGGGSGADWARADGRIGRSGRDEESGEDKARIPPARSGLVVRGWGWSRTFVLSGPGEPYRPSRLRSLSMLVRRISAADGQELLLGSGTSAKALRSGHERLEQEKARRSVLPDPDGWEKEVRRLGRVEDEEDIRCAQGSGLRVLWCGRTGGPSRTLSAIRTPAAGIPVDEEVEESDGFGAKDKRIGGDDKEEEEREGPGSGGRRPWNDRLRAGEESP